MHHGDCQDACFTGFTARPPCQAENEEVGYAGWQLACLLACRAASFDIALTEHVTSAGVRDQPALIRLLTVLEDLDGFLTKLQQCLAGCRKTEHDQLQLRDVVRTRRKRKNPEPARAGRRPFYTVYRSFSRHGITASDAGIQKRR